MNQVKRTFDHYYWYVKICVCSPWILTDNSHQHLHGGSYGLCRASIQRSNWNNVDLVRHGGTRQVDSHPRNNHELNPLQGGVPVNARSCKHLISLLGEKYEAARVKLKNPDGPPLKGSKKPASKTKAKAKAKAPPKRKRRNDDEDEDEDEDDDKPTRSPKKARKAPTSARGKVNAKDDDEDDADDGDDDEEEPEADAKKVPELLLANKWDIETGPDPTGWWISEKLDGVR